MKKAISFMAIAKGSESKEVEIKRHIGIAAVGVLAVNPTRAELNSIYGSEGNTDEPTYVGETTVKNLNGEDVKVPQIRLSFITKTDPKIACNHGLEAILPINLFLTKSYVYSQKNGVTKVQVIDKYGRTSWVTQEELKAGAIPEFVIKKGPNAGQTMKAQLSAGYRPCYMGEENLVKLLIALINIPRPDVWNEDQKTYVMKTDPKELAQSECFLENIKEYFSGNIKELRDAVKFQPNNRFKMLFGVRTSKNGSVYQTAYVSMPLKLNVTSYKGLEDALADDKAAGRHPSEVYEVCDIKEYSVTATDYGKVESKEDDDPFAKPVTVSTEAPAPEPQMPMDSDVDPFAK